MRAFMLAETRVEIEQVWWPPLRTSHLFYKNLGFFESGRFNTEWEPWVRTVKDEEWTFDRVAPNRIIAGTPEQVVARFSGIAIMSVANIWCCTCAIRRGPITSR